MTAQEAAALAASAGPASVANKYVPSAGSASHVAVQQVARHMQQSRADGHQVDPRAAIQHAAEAHVKKGVNAVAGGLIKQYTGLSVQPKFTPTEVKQMASMIQPSDVQMVRARVVGGWVERLGSIRHACVRVFRVFSSVQPADAST